jgi:type IX secretion system PorP/SprF family membrane protein
MSIRNIYIIIVILVSVGSAHAQQVQQFTQFRHTGLSYNPAFAGIDTFFNGFAIHRTQWVGVNDAPRTYMLGLDAPSASQKMGFGGSLYTDVTGPTRRTGINGTYSYHIQVSSQTKVSMGLTFGITQFTLDGSQITLRDASDRTITNNMQSELKPDASFGVLWYGERFYAGISAGQILNNDLTMFAGDGDGKMAVHYFLTGAYRFTLSDLIDLEPAVLAKYVDPLTPQIDLAARIIYNGNIWLGGTYRTNAAAAIFAGYQVLDYLSIGYSFDFATTDIQNYSDGTHEILLGVRFVKKQMISPTTE